MNFEILQRRTINQGKQDRADYTNKYHGRYEFEGNAEADDGRHYSSTGGVIEGDDGWRDEWSTVTDGGHSGEGDGRRGYRAVADGRRAEACCDYSAEGVETSMHFSHAYYAEVSQLIKKQWFDTRLILCFHFKCFHFICVSNFISFV